MISFQKINDDIYISLVDYWNVSRNETKNIMVYCLIIHTKIIKDNNFSDVKYLIEGPTRKMKRSCRSLLIERVLLYYYLREESAAHGKKLGSYCGVRETRCARPRPSH